MNANANVCVCMYVCVYVYVYVLDLVNERTELGISKGTYSAPDHQCLESFVC